jgi:hypothetical protein
VLYLVISGAPAPEGLPSLVMMLQSAGWQVMVFSTPTGTRFADVTELERLTGEPVRWEYRMPGTGSRVSPADVVLACPAIHDGHGVTPMPAANRATSHRTAGGAAAATPRTRGRKTERPVTSSGAVTLASRSAVIAAAPSPDHGQDRRPPVFLWLPLGGY